MSLHNSTNREPNGLFYLVDLIGIEREAFTAFPTNSKPSEAGLNLRGGTAKQSAVFDRDECSGRKRSVRMLIPTRSS